MGDRPVTVLGGGLAGCEVAWRLARHGVPVELWEMRPGRMTPAHRGYDLAELVCSNSLKSESAGSASRWLKDELRLLGSLTLAVAETCRVPAGHALAVDRQAFAAAVTRRMTGHPLIRVRREEATSLPPGRPLVLATGPLTSDALAGELARLTGQANLYFFDAVSPVVAGDSVDQSVAFAAARYDRGGADYLNCPFDQPAYERFVAELVAAERHPPRDFEPAALFEGCLPVEELAARGVDTLRFGPLKPVGLADPRTGRTPWAVVQLRRETVLADAWNLVGFQTSLRYGEQERVFRLVPGLERAVFLRLGRMHRNTYLNAPRLLAPDQSLRAAPGVYMAGQLCGLEGYVEAAATGLLAAAQVLAARAGRPAVRFPRETALGSLQHALTASDPECYQPVNMTLALLPEPDPAWRRRFRLKAERNTWRAGEGVAACRAYAVEAGLLADPASGPDQEGECPAGR